MEADPSLVKVSYSALNEVKALISIPTFHHCQGKGSMRTVECEDDCIKAKIYVSVVDPQASKSRIVGLYMYLCSYQTTVTVLYRTVLLLVIYILAVYHVIARS